MYISCLLIDVGTNPDRPRPGRLWLRNLYHVHQRLCMAFPSAERQGDDPYFLKPYKPDDFPEDRYLADRKQGDAPQEVPCEVLKQVHRARDNDAGFLFRVDAHPGGRVVIVVQSARKPKWEYAFGLNDGLVNDRGQPIGNAGYLLAARPEWEHLDPHFTAGERLRFCLAANPTRRFYSKDSLEGDGTPVKNWANKRGKGKRVPVPFDQLLDWLAEYRFRENGEDVPSGFSLHKERTSLQTGYVYMNKGRNGSAHRLFSVRYEGFLEVTHPDRFRATLFRGIGPGKAFGFGLLSVAPCRTPAVADAL